MKDHDRQSQDSRASRLDLGNNDLLTCALHSHLVLPEIKSLLFAHVRPLFLDKCLRAASLNAVSLYRANRLGCAEQTSAKRH